MMLKKINRQFLFILFCGFSSPIYLHYQFRNFEEKKIDISDHFNEDTTFSFERNSIPLNKANEFIQIRNNFHFEEFQSLHNLIKSRTKESEYLLSQVNLLRRNDGGFELSLKSFSKINLSKASFKEWSIGFLNCINAFYLGETIIVVCANISPNEVDQRIKFENIIFFLCDEGLVCEQFQFDFISFAHFNYNFNLQDNSSRFLRLFGQMEMVKTDDNSCVVIGLVEESGKVSKTKSLAIQITFDRNSNFIRISNRYLPKEFEFQIFEIKEVFPNLLILVRENSFCLTFKEKFEKFLSSSKTESEIICDSNKYLSYFYNFEDETISFVTLHEKFVYKQVYKVKDEIRYLNTIKITTKISSTEHIYNFFEINKSRIVIMSEFPDYKSTLYNGRFLLKLCVSFNFQKYENLKSCLIQREIKFSAQKINYSPEKPLINLFKAKNKEKFILLVNQVFFIVAWKVPMFELVISSEETADYNVVLGSLKNSIFINVGQNLPQVWDNRKYLLKSFNNAEVFTDKIMLNFLSGNLIQYENQDLFSISKSFSFDFSPEIQINDLTHLEIYQNSDDKKLVLKARDSNKSLQLFQFTSRMNFLSRKKIVSDSFSFIGPLFTDKFLLCNENYCIIKKNNFFENFEQFNSIINIKCQKVNVVNITFVLAYILCFNDKHVDIYPMSPKRIELKNPYQFRFLNDDEELDNIFISQYNPNLIIFGIKPKQSSVSKYYLLGLKVKLKEDGLQKANVYEPIFIDKLVKVDQPQFSNKLIIQNVLIFHNRIVILLLNAEDFFILNYKYNEKLELGFLYLISSKSFSIHSQQSLNIRYLLTTSRIDKYGVDNSAIVLKLQVGLKHFLVYFQPQSLFYNSISPLIPIKSGKIIPIKQNILKFKRKQKFDFFIAEIHKNAIVSISRIKSRKSVVIDMKEFLQKPILTFTSFDANDRLEFDTSNLSFIKSFEIANEGYSQRKILIPKNAQLPMYFTLSKTKINGNVFEYKLSSNFNLDLITQDIQLKEIVEDVPIFLEFAKNLNNFKFEIVDNIVILYNQNFLVLYNPDGTLLKHFITNSLFILDTVSILQAFNLKVNERFHFSTKSSSYIKVFWNEKYIYLNQFNLSIFSSDLKLGKKKVLSNYYRNLEIEMFDEFIFFKSSFSTKIALIDSLIRGADCFYIENNLIRIFDVYWLSKEETDFLKLESEAFWLGSFKKNSEKLFLELFTVERRCLTKSMIGRINMQELNFIRNFKAIKITYASNKLLKIILLSDSMINPILEIKYDQIFENFKNVHKDIDKIIKENYSGEIKDREFDLSHNGLQNSEIITDKNGINVSAKESSFENSEDIYSDKLSLSQYEKETGLDFNPLKSDLKLDLHQEKKFAKSENFAQYKLDQEKIIDQLMKESKQIFASNFGNKEEPVPTSKAMTIDFKDYRKLLSQKIIKRNLFPSVSFILKPLSIQNANDMIFLAQSNFVFIRQFSENQAFFYCYEIKSEKMKFFDNIEKNVNQNFETKNFYGTYFLFNEKQFSFIKSARLIKIIGENSQSFKLIALGEDYNFHIITIQKNLQLIIKASSIKSTNLHLSYKNSIWKYEEVISVVNQNEGPDDSGSLRRFLLLVAVSSCYTALLIILTKFAKR